ncbi:hypothetical protein IM511_09045 [Erythrobacteraceae bacterium E2-1 Yellow Sea]|nr:hypothetical protein [Erythrobacteraceae bacterium E2-1 Yellow Sea]
MSKVSIQRSVWLTVLLTAGAACSPPDGGDVLDGLNLTSSQRATADALIEGQLKASAIPMLRKRDYLAAACYAKKVDMPSHMGNAHRAYLANFEEADKDYYGFFAKQGLYEETAYSVFERYEAAMKQCSL